MKNMAVTLASPASVVDVLGRFRLRPSHIRMIPLVPKIRHGAWIKDHPKSFAWSDAVIEKRIDHSDRLDHFRTRDDSLNAAGSENNFLPR